MERIIRSSPEIQATPPTFPSQRYVILPKLYKVLWSQVLEVIEYVEYERLDKEWGALYLYICAGMRLTLESLMCLQVPHHLCFLNKSNKFLDMPGCVLVGSLSWVNSCLSI